MTPEREPATAVVMTGLAEVDEVADVLRAELRRTRATQLSLELALEERAGAHAQRDLLLREVYHRVKNNLQIVDLLLSMQERQLSDNEAKLALTTLRGRIQVLGLVHEQLMKSGDLVTFDIAPFLDELSRNIVASGADRTVSTVRRCDAVDGNIGLRDSVGARGDRTRDQLPETCIQAGQRPNICDIATQYEIRSCPHSLGRRRRFSISWRAARRGWE